MLRANLLKQLRWRIFLLIVRWCYWGHVFFSGQSLLLGDVAQLRKVVDGAIRWIAEIGRGFGCWEFRAILVLDHWMCSNIPRTMQGGGSHFWMLWRFPKLEFKLLVRCFYMRFQVEHVPDLNSVKSTGPEHDLNMTWTWPVNILVISRFPDFFQVLQCFLKFRRVFFVSGRLVSAIAVRPSVVAGGSVSCADPAEVRSR